ncbi:MAG: NAD-dependent epimerase/dehydratase family protein [Acidimicrobiales bacterium]|nr:NAD-dependent epimerase/dehydratase family protein [Acidimicrobiales bacterium]
MRALVTGASGFLGSRLVWQLHAHGHDVVVLLRPTSDRARVARADPEVAIGDITDPSSLAAAMGAVDVAFHTAAQYEMGPEDPSTIERVNVEGSRNVFEAAAAAGVPVVHTSSVTAHGPTGAQPVDEHHWSDAAPVSHYQRTKRESHLVAREFRAAGADVRIASPVGIYGPGDTSTLGRLIRLYMTVPMPVVAFRDAVQSTVHVDDCADGMLRIAEDGPSGGEYILSAESVTMQAWIEAMMRAADKPYPLYYVPDRWVAEIGRYVEWLVHALDGPHQLIHEYIATAVQNAAFSGQKARDELGWNPRPLDHGLAQVAESFGRGPLVRR